MKGSLKKGFLTYVLLFVGLIFTVLLILASILLFSPGASILGFTFVRDNKDYNIETYKTVASDGSEVDTILNLQKISKLKISANNFDIRINTGDVSYIKIENNAMAFTKVENGLGIDINTHYDQNTNTLEITVKDYAYLLNLKDNRIITVYLNQEDYSNLDVEFTTKNGDIGLGGSSAQKSLNHVIKSVVAKTENGNIGASNLKIFDKKEEGSDIYLNYAYAELSTQKGSVSIPSNWENTQFSKLIITANNGQIKTGKINAKEVFLNGKMVEADLGEIRTSYSYREGGIISTYGKVFFNIESGIVNITDIVGDLINESENISNVKLNIGRVFYDVTLNSVNSSNININLIAGDATIKTKSGDISINAIEGKCDLETESGKILVGIDSSLTDAKTYDVKTTKGDIDVYYFDGYGVTNIQSETGDIKFLYKTGDTFKLSTHGKKVNYANEELVYENLADGEYVTGYPVPNSAEVTVSNTITITTEKNVTIQHGAFVVIS